MRAKISLLIGNWVKIFSLSVAISCFLLAPLFQIQRNKETEFLSETAEVFKNRSLSQFSGFGTPDEAKILSVMNSLYDNMNYRWHDIGEATLGNPSSLFRWVSEDLNDSGGACGGFTVVLGRMLMELGYEVRKIGLEKGEDLSMHHVLEVKLGNRWALLDPLFNLAFRRPDGLIASASDVSRNWEYYRRQPPSNYPQSYDYQAYHYTNWKRLGWIGSLLERMIDSKALDRRFSAFKYLINKDKYLPGLFVCIGILMLAVGTALHFFARCIKRQISPQRTERSGFLDG